VTRLPRAVERALLPDLVHVAESRRAQARSSEDIVSTSARQFTGPTQIHERRSHPRLLPGTLIYVACGESNGGMVLNVCDDGMAISMAIPVGDEAYSNLHVRMNGLSQSIEVHGRMAWTTKSKKRAGIHLVDISDEQRGRIREWLARDGVRDVNLLPRVPEAADAILPALADAAISPALVEKPRDMSPVAASALINPPVLAEPHASLLAGLGGTPPEFLGPAQDEPVQDDPAFSEGESAETQPYQGSNSNFSGFRENEWDLASVTMVPRKRSKPAGLSALGLLLLWIAIPSFGIGIMVGRRPLQQWLSRGFAVRKNISHVDAPETEIARARDESPNITSSDIDATGPHSIPARSTEAPAITNSQDVKTPDATKSFVSTPAFVDTNLLNSMSTQELRALKAPASTAPPENPNASELSRADSKANRDAAAKDAFSPPAAIIKPVTPANTVPPSTNRAISSAPATGNSTTHQNASGLTQGVQAAANASTPSSQSVNRSVTTASGAAGNSVASSSPVSDASRNGNTVLTASKTQPASPSSPVGTPYGSTSPKPEPRIASDATPRMAPNVRPNMASSAYASSSSRSVGPSAATNLAPVNAQPALHGVMLVARKNNESFLLRLPVESVAGGRSVAVEMQRFVMVPAESRWHHHGPIAKLAVGELLTQVAPNQVEMASNARPGDAVTVRAFVDKNGSVEDLKPVSGRFALMPRVMHDVREWQFDQTLIDGKPVESEVNITFEFRSGAQPNRSREIQAQNSFKP
jgi:PilZ domain